MGISTHLYDLPHIEPDAPCLALSEERTRNCELLDRERRDINALVGD